MNEIQLPGKPGLSLTLIMIKNSSGTNALRSKIEKHCFVDYNVKFILVNILKPLNPI